MITKENRVKIDTEHVITDRADLDGGIGERSIPEVKKKILLAGSMNPRNKGDQARIKATINKLTENGDISLGLLSHNFKTDKAVYSEDNVEVVKAPWSGDNIRILRLASLALFTLIGYTFLSFARRFLKLPVKTRLFEYDALVIASGIDFSDFAGRLPLYYSFFLIIMFAVIMKIPVMCYAQSIGPVQNRTLQKLTRYFLNKMHTISVRDESSLAYIRELKVNRPIIYTTVDPAFLLYPEHDNKDDVLAKYGIQNTRRPIIGVSLSTAPFAGPGNGYCSMGLWYKVNKHKATLLSDEYTRKMARLCDRLVELYRATLVFIPNCTANGDDDRECMNKVHQLMSFKDYAVCINNEFSLTESFKIIGNCDFFMGTRLHASVLAAIMAVPLVPLVGTDGPRVPGLMKMLGLGDHVRNIVTEKESRILSTIDEIWNMREPMRMLLRARVSKLREQALTNIDIVREFCSLDGNHNDTSG